MDWNPKRYRKISFLVMGIGIAVGLLGIAADVFPMYAVAACVILLAAGAFLNICFYRCPFCKEYLGRESVEYCPHCGRKLM